LAARLPDPAQIEQVRKEITQLLLENQATIFSASKDVMVADASSGDAFTSRARPTVVYWSMISVTAIAVLAMIGHADPILAAFAKAPDKLWDMMTYGIGPT
jgi:hypothetical protein